MHILVWVSAGCILILLVLYILDHLFSTESKSFTTKTIDSFPIALRLVRSPELVPNARRILNSVCRRVNIQVNYKLFETETTFVDARDDAAERVIYVYFEKGGEHRGHKKFDGPKGVLAHAVMDGDELCFDADETWTDARLRCVALHELLHNLGVDHNTRPDSVMNSTYKGRPELGQSDIAELQQLYPFIMSGGYTAPLVDQSIEWERG